MKVEDIQVDQIEVTERRREDFGDLQGLAEGINRVGLLAPILVDRNGGDRFRLIFGERRLRAVKLLGLQTIAAQLREHLTDEEFRAIELEENDNRKALTEGERARTFESSKKLVEQSKKAAEVLEHTVPKPKPSKKGGRPVKPASTRAVAKALGTSHTDVIRAKQHVETAERFPFMKGRDWTQTKVLAVRESLQKLPEDQRTKTISVLNCMKDLKPWNVESRIDAFKAKPPQDQNEIHQLSQSEDERDKSLALTIFREWRLEPLEEISTRLEQMFTTSRPDEFTPRLKSIHTAIREVCSDIRNRTTKTDDPVKEQIQ